MADFDEEEQNKHLDEVHKQEEEELDNLNKNELRNWQD